MVKLAAVAFCLIVFGCNVVWCDDDAEFPEEPEKEVKDEMEKVIMEQIFQILEHYKQEDPVGLPNSPIQDPMPLPDMTKSFSLHKMEFRSMQMYGFSKCRIVRMKSNLADMEVATGLAIDQLLIKGKYKMNSWFQSSSGPFTVTLDDVFVTGVSSLEVSREGKLEAQDMKMDITCQNIDLNFENQGLMGSILKMVINSVGTFLFDSLKPFIIGMLNLHVRDEVNKHLMKIEQTFPNSIPPLDMAIAEMRKYVRGLNYDPYRMDNFNHTAGIFALELSNVWLYGLASFHRVGNMSIFMEKNTAHFGVSIGTRRLKGSCQWEVGVAGLLSRSGGASFTVEYVQAEVQVAQPLDVRKRPKLEELNLRVGNVQARMDGAGTADYLVEAMVNVLPNLLRYQIVEVLEGPLKRKIQASLDEVDVEQMIAENVPKVYKLVSNYESLSEVNDNNLLHNQL